MKITNEQIRQIIKEELQNYYSVLDVNNGQPTADQKIIKKGWREKAKATHPDRGGDAEKFKKASGAYGTLSDLDKKKQYDQQLYKQTDDCKEQNPDHKFCVVNGIRQDDESMKRFAELAGISAEADGEAAQMDPMKFMMVKQKLVAKLQEKVMAKMKENKLDHAQNFLDAIDEVLAAKSVNEIKAMYDAFF